MTTSVVDDEQHNRFELNVDGERAGEIDYVIEEGAIHLVHTEVSKDRREKGLASSFVEQVLGELRESTSLRVVADCPYVAHWLTEHDGYDDLLTR